MNDIPPSRARATAILLSDTDCIIAETNGMFSEIADSSPLRNFTAGVLSEIFEGIHSADEYPGIIRYSPNVREGSEQIIAIIFYLHD
jgi:hypothetical protein